MGVPQESIKGPIFGIYNMVESCAQVTALAYADDLLFVKTGGNEMEVKDRAQRTVRMAVDWLEARGLLIVRGPRSVEGFKLECLGQSTSLLGRSNTLVWSSRRTYDSLDT